MNPSQKTGALAALYLAAAYLIGIVLFIFVLDYPNIHSAAQKVALVVQQQTVMYATNLVMYVIFGVVLVVLVFALYDRLKTGAPAMMRVAATLGVIWAGSLIASGMVANAGIAPVAALYTQDPAQAAWTWLSIETVSSGLGNGNGEILGGLFTLLVSWAALRAGGLPKALNVLGVVVGLVGVVSTVPGLGDLVSLFGATQIAWYVWLAAALLRESPNAAARKASLAQA